LKAMQKDKRARYADMEALRADLLDYLASVGRDEGLESARLSHLGAGELRSESGRQREVATRGDIDRYERSIRRRTLWGYAFGVVLLAGAASAGVFGWLHRPVAQPS